MAEGVKSSGGAELSAEPNSPEDYSEQEGVRRDKLAALRQAGYPFPNDVRVTASAESVRTAASGDLSAVERQTVAGRIVSLRLMGKAAFFNIQDRTGRLQVYLKRDEIGADLFEQFKTFDLGDIVETAGKPFVTKTGEPSLHADSVRLLVKCLHPLPEKWHGLTDVEVRYRRRYVDLIVNPDVTQTFVKRSKIIREIRNFFDRNGYFEVETPVLNTVASGAAARPFTTHHNTLDLDLHLRIALELPLKKLIVGGMERVYEIGRVFRNEGISTEHNPEFTMIEFYQAYATYRDLIGLTEELVVGLCDSVVGSRTVEWRGQPINFERPWKVLTMRESIYEIGGLERKQELDTLAGVSTAAAGFRIDQSAFNGADEANLYGLLLFEIFDRIVQPKIIDPTFITEHPLAISPLARPNIADPRFVDRFELFVAGVELANAFSELNDAEDQRDRLLAQGKKQDQGDNEAMGYDEDFVTAIEYGLPPTAGEGIGIDRLVMILTNSSSIRDVILFPTMRPAS